LRELTLILTDLYLDHGSASDAAGWPRLAGLETVLTRGFAVDSRDWRSWVCERLGLTLPSRLAIAAIARHTGATERAPAGQWWLAESIHLEAGVDRVYLTAEAPELSPGEWRELERGFNQAFAAAGFRLVDGAASHAYVASTAHLDVDTIDPARVRGRDILQGFPRGADAAVLNRLMTEIQMWLHEHPVNIARQDRGVATINGLWIWGGGQGPVITTKVAPPALGTDDRFLRGLWALTGGAHERLPPTFEALDFERHDSMLITLASAPAKGESAAQALMNLERDWFQPALASLRKGRISRLQLHVNDRLFSLTRLAAWRWWQRLHPWPEKLA
jgi:hypothetical protein